MTDQIAAKAPRVVQHMAEVRRVLVALLAVLETHGPHVSEAAFMQACVEFVSANAHETVARNSRARLFLLQLLDELRSSIATAGAVSPESSANEHDGRP